MRPWLHSHTHSGPWRAPDGRRPQRLGVFSSWLLGDHYGSVRSVSARLWLAFRALWPMWPAPYRSSASRASAPMWPSGTGGSLTGSYCCAIPWLLLSWGPYSGPRARFYSASPRRAIWHPLSGCTASRGAVWKWLGRSRSWSMLSCLCMPSVSGSSLATRHCGALAGKPGQALFRGG